MKEIDRFFAMKMLERTSGKTRDQILEEAQLGTGDWAMGMPELERVIDADIKFAKEVLKHFSFRRPSHIRKEDIEAIDFQIKGTGSSIREFEFETHREKIKAVFNIFEES